METSILQWKEGASVRMQMIKDEPWFAAKDVCELLGLDNSRQAVSRLDDDEKGVINSDTLGGKQELTFVNESGMYALIFQSRKPQARAFRKWVTGEVLPSLRKYGYYVAPGAQLTDEQREELERVMMGRMRRYLSRRDYIQVARSTGYPVWFVQRVVAGQAGGHAGSVMLALQERALKNCQEYVNPLSEARMTSVIERLS
ncbi:antirepressor [Tannerella sp. oral taxon BU063 isolate Cell 2]|uniref:Antirepressor n=1 Tax=Tannerella sp. oral taxon BU063 isolate Cell 2 TaxID=1411148 RepID=W2C387_9BACT|nr:antirepressor [Tannerella sp. oral taxon BU063 isolate Cell 2]